MIVTSEEDSYCEMNGYRSGGRYFHSSHFSQKSQVADRNSYDFQVVSSFEGSVLLEF